MKDQIPSIKILITYKFQHALLKSDILTPIQSGRALSKIKFENMIGDDTGDNISTQNDNMSELSALYWAWKNYDQLGNPDYIGHMHYRRQFVFDETLALPQFKWISSFYYISTLDEARAYFRDESIREMVPNYDVLIPAWHVTPTKNIREEYINNIPGSRAYIFDVFIEICKEMLPAEYKEEIERIEKGNIVSVCHMFVMKKEIFFDYCKFAFPVLFELRKRVGATELKGKEARFVGYMGEKMQTMFLFHLMKNKNIKIKYLNALLVNPPKDNSTWGHVQKHFERVCSPFRTIFKWLSELLATGFYFVKWLLHL